MVEVEGENNAEPTDADENIAVDAGGDQIPVGRKDDDFEEMEVPPEDLKEDMDESDDSSTEK